MQLKKLRNDAGLSQEFVARHLNVSRITVKNWEDERTVPPADKAVRLARLFGVTVEELMEVKK